MSPQDRPARAFLVLLAALILLPSRAAWADRVILSDDFEDAHTIDDLIQPGRWTYVQLENPGSTVEISTAQAHSGVQAVRYFGHPSGSNITKADLAKDDVRFRAGQTIDIDSWFFLSDGADLSDLYLIDAECTVCSPQSPGLRVRIEDGYPEIERSKMQLPTVSQRKLQIAVGQWFELRLRLKLGVVAQGQMTLWVNGVKVIARRGTTVTPYGAMVDSIQIGLTANASRADAELFADDVLIRQIGR